ncbi:sulfatase-like hydrolase/transferase [Flexithrix dorotheae]|uniref:sulfatase-like hydrolase/transferase n=1 Tax=Flexithrix dorotheae TaxID=70993 RepID=UPI001FDFD576|nr:sulfatase-like hydrolase/transferase [Flexithrix dorotheae]
MRQFYLLMIITFFAACAPEKPENPAPPNILWISCEDISPAWGCYGDQQATTPNIDLLADKGFVFTQAFSNAPICSPARSTLITGMYAKSLGTQNLRSDIPIPADLKILPEVLKANGYYTTNNAKTDYNFSHEGRWDDSSNKAHWRNKPEGKPFFSVFNFGITHEGHANTDKKEDTETLPKKHDPANMKLPPYFPETEEFKNIMAHQYDLITVFDQEVGKLVDQLKADGLYDNTIIFVFSDHGYGLPRYKRWLYDTGLKVPFVLHVPEKYKDKAANLTQSKVDKMVGFVDFAPTVLNLANVAAPQRMEGQNFLGKDAPEKPYIFGYRDRADDVYDMSRSIFDGRYLYVRNYMPQKPYIQNAIIFNKGKRSYEELFRVKEAGNLPPEAQDMFAPKPVEELYDLQNDPNELNNIVDEPQLAEKVKSLKARLHQHIIETKDTGLMNEGDMMVRAGNQSVYEMTHDAALFNPEKILKAAELVGKVTDINQLATYFEDEDAAVRFWAMQALDAFEGDISSQKPALKKLLEDPSVPNRALAAELLLNKYNDESGLEVLKEALTEKNEPVLLQVAINVRNIGEKAKPLVPFIKENIYPEISGEVWGRYKSWLYPMFIGMALDQTLANCGEEVVIEN